MGGQASVVSASRKRSSAGLLTIGIAAALFCAQPRAADEKTTYSSEYAISQLMPQLQNQGFDADTQFKVQRHWTDSLGHTHTHLQQQYKGVTVWTAQTIVHLNPQGKVHVLATQRLMPAINLNVKPTLSMKQALTMAEAASRVDGKPYASEPAITLVVLPHTERVRRDGKEQIPDELLNAADLRTQVRGYSLAYHVHLEMEDGTEAGTWHRDYMVDAHSGGILLEWMSLQTRGPEPECGPPEAVYVVCEGHAIGMGHSQYSGDVLLSTTWSTVRGDPGAEGGTTFLLRDRTRGVGEGNRTYNMDRNGRTDDAGISADIRLRGTLYADWLHPLVYWESPNDWGDNLNMPPGVSTTSANGQTAAVDAHFGVQVNWDMLLYVFGRNGIDGAGRSVYNRVHYGTSFDNAFWSPTCFCLTYGDGSAWNNVTGLDVVGHELAHGLTANTAGFVYLDEAGGLNEATSDIFGTLGEFYHRGDGYDSRDYVIPATGGNWLIGEGVVRGGALRAMDLPSEYGSPNAWTMDIVARNTSARYPRGIPHRISGPLRRWFYFLSQGASSTRGARDFSGYLPGGMSGIGIHKAGQIWYHALITYLTAWSDYQEAGAMTIQAAGDLYGSGSIERRQTCLAFAAINVGAAADCP